MDYAVLKKNFENHRFHTSYFETKEEAAAYLSNQIKGEKVGFGGSITAKEMNLFEVLGKDNEVIWHWDQGPDARIKAKGSTVYILSAQRGLPATGRSSTSTEPETVFPRAYLDRNEYTM